ncbi:MAG: hypothetical protein FIA99_07710, partial [Ruminiclostridium sp.]|nr:hypothetical protein [Ruminiclostridium sp.]
MEDLFLWIRWYCWMITNKNGGRIMNNFKCCSRQPVLNFLSEREMDDIHFGSLEILENTGLNVHHKEARELLYNAGAFVDGINVKIPS